MGSRGKTCTKCPEPSLPGLVSGNELCQFHYDEYMWGTEWALYCKKQKEVEELPPKTTEST